MHPATQDIELLLAASRDLLRTEELDAERLQAWGAERNAIFCRLKADDLALASADSSELESLMRELVDLDGKICARVIENQRQLGKQIATARKIRQAVWQGTSRSPQLLKRLA